MYTVGERSQQQVFNFVKNQWILMQFSLLDLKMKGARNGTTFTHLT